MHMGATAPGVALPRWPHDRPAGFPLWGVHGGHLERLAVHEENRSHRPVDHPHHPDVNAIARRWHARKVAGAAAGPGGSAHWHHRYGCGRIVLVSRHHQTRVPPHGWRKVSRPGARSREVCLRARVSWPARTRWNENDRTLARSHRADSAASSGSSPPSAATRLYAPMAACARVSWPVRTRGKEKRPHRGRDPVQRWRHRRVGRHHQAQLILDKCHEPTPVGGRHLSPLPELQQCRQHPWRQSPRTAVVVAGTLLDGHYGESVQIGVVANHVQKALLVRKRMLDRSLLARCVGRANLQAR